MLSIDFDAPTYLRVGHGLAVVSNRLDHLLPDPLPSSEEVIPSEKVVINRVFNPARLSVVEDKEAIQPPRLDAEPTKTSSDTEVDAIDPDLTSNEPTQESAQPEDATELSFRGSRSKPVSGVFLGCGHAPYRFNKGNSGSFFLRIDKSLIWGIELKSALKQSNAKKGDRIEVTFLGKVPLKVLTRVKKGTGTEEVWETRHRNRWGIRVLSD